MLHTAWKIVGKHITVEANGDYGLFGTEHLFRREGSNQFNYGSQAQNDIAPKFIIWK